MSDKDIVSVGKISGVFGVKGWVKVFSFTDARENILDYSPWLLRKGDETRLIKVLDGTVQGKSVLAQLDSVTDRDQAALLMGWEIFISPEQLPETAEGEYYWSELIGLKVATTHGVQLGLIDSLMETGANDIIIVHGEREHVIPFLQGQTIINIDLDIGIMVVDWDPDF